MGSDKRVVIVGAGSNGLVCAITSRGPEWR